MPSKDADTGTPTPSGASEPPSTDTSQSTEEGTDVGTSGQQEGKRRFGGLTPREAGLRSAQARKERSIAQAEQIRAQSDGRVLLARVPVALGDIVARLSADAVKGDARAAAELRTWLREYPAEDDTDMSTLDKRTRQALMARLLAEIEAEEGRPPASPEA